MLADRLHLHKSRPERIPGCLRVTVTVPDRPSHRARGGHSRHARLGWSPSRDDSDSGLRARPAYISRPAVAPAPPRPRRGCQIIAVPAVPVAQSRARSRRPGPDRPRPACALPRSGCQGQTRRRRYGRTCGLRGGLGRVLRRPGGSGSSRLAHRSLADRSIAIRRCAAVSLLTLLLNTSTGRLLFRPHIPDLARDERAFCAVAGRSHWLWPPLLLSPLLSAATASPAVQP
jgi:hypothetical protein